MNTTFNQAPLTIDTAGLNLAKYREESFELYAGNPYIEALPDIPDEKELIRRLVSMPKFTPQEREMSEAHRLMALSKLKRIFVPTPRVVDLARSMQLAIFEGYAPRSPGSSEDRALARQLGNALKTGSFSELGHRDLATQLSMGLIGSSGQGKTFTLRNIANSFKPYYFHEKTGKWQIPFILVELPYDGKSVNTLAKAIVMELDRILPDANYFDAVMNSRGHNAETRLLMALRLCYEHGVGMILVDEAQNQASSEGEDAQTKKRRDPKDAARENPLVKLLITASNVSHIPLLMTGTPEMFNTVGNRFSRARRMVGNGSALWEPLTRSAPGATGEFELQLRVLFRYQWVKTPIEYSEEWADFFHRVTGGIPDIMNKLWSATQRAAITDKVETITREGVFERLRTEFRPALLGIETVLNQESVPAEMHSPDLITPQQHVMDRCVTDVPFQFDAERVLPEHSSEGTSTGTRKKTKRRVKVQPIPAAATLDPKVLESARLRADSSAHGAQMT